MIAYGIWDHIKNRGDHGADNWVLDWAGFLPGKRESRRFVGDYTLTQNDIETEGRHFDDIVAFGGWTMDDHFPEGFYKKEAGTIFHPAPSPYGIPYRCLYSRNIKNLLFAGRNISATHAALSSTRVMATCSLLGQAVGTAAHIAVTHTVSPRGVYEHHLEQLKNMLMYDDSYLPFNRRPIGELTAQATIDSSNDGAPEKVRNGFDRPIGYDDNAWSANPGDSIELTWEEPVAVGAVRLVFDSNLSRPTHNMVSYYTLDIQPFRVPEQLVKAFSIYIKGNDGDWTHAFQETNNYQRLVWVKIDAEITGLRFIPEASWGDEAIRVFAIDAEAAGPSSIGI